MIIPATMPTILVVDDNEDNREVLGRRLLKLGFDVLKAESGKAALHLINKRVIDLVLLDVMMPEMDGIEVLQIVRAELSLEELPIIMVTARSDASDIVEALKLGANDYVTKPIDFSITLARIQSQLARKNAVAELKLLNAKLEKEISDRKRANEQLNFLSNHDALTGLGNRDLLIDCLERELARAERNQTTAAVVQIDIHDFKSLNDTLGFTTGDLALKAVAQRLQSCVRSSDAISRTGSDEFAILLTDLASPDAAGMLVDRIVSEISRDIDFGEHRFKLDFATGIAIAPSDGRSAGLVLANANLALQRAKADGPNERRFFEQKLNDRATLRRRLKIHLQCALQNGEFQVHYQPLVNLSTNQISGFEALLRWTNSEIGHVSPADFIPLAEESGLIHAIGVWVLRESCRTALTWPTDIKVAVNISPVQFRHPDFMTSVRNTLRETGLSPERLELELTESVLISDGAGVRRSLSELRNLGVRLSLDDFGTGYSSLSYLQHFPFSKIKIDQSFIRDLDSQAANKPIVQAIIALAKGLGMSTTAEGVETKSQLDWLGSAGCEEVQGYLISRPLPREAVVFKRPVMKDENYRDSEPIISSRQYAA